MLMRNRQDRTGGTRRGPRGGLAAAFAAGLLAAAPAAAQQGSGGLVVVSEPYGARVTLDGEIRIEGVAPLAIDRGLEGAYRVSAELPGYESWRRDIQLSAARTDTLHIELTARTRARAGVRSLAVPGWGQRYVGRSRPGSFYFFTTAAMGVVGVYQQARYKGAVDRYELLRARYRIADDGDEARVLFARMEEEYGDARDHRDRRNAFLYAGAAVWAVSFLDAVVNFPAPGSGHLTLAARPGPGGAPGVALSRGF